MKIKWGYCFPCSVSTAGPLAILFSTSAHIAGPSCGLPVTLSGQRETLTPPSQGWPRTSIKYSCERVRPKKYQPLTYHREMFFNSSFFSLHHPCSSNEPFRDGERANVMKVTSAKTLKVERLIFALTNIPGDKREWITESKVLSE